MQEHVKILDKSFALSLHKATVIHSDKFTETSGGYANLPVYSTLYTSVVFRSEETDEDWPMTIRT